MRSFWGFYDNRTYHVGCNGSTVYIYDQKNKELGRFQDIKHAYAGVFQPNTNIFVVKSTEGFLAVYDLDRMELQKIIVVTRIGAQDEGFAFSPDGKYFFNIEKPFHSFSTQLTVYRTTDYEIAKVLLYDDKSMVLDSLEFDEFSADCYILGFMRDRNNIIDFGFIGKLTEERVDEIVKLNKEEYHYIRAYKSWERSGYTSKKLKCSYINDYVDKTPVSLKQVHSVKIGNYEISSQY